MVGKYLVQADQTVAAAAASGGAAKTASLLGELPEHIPGTPTPDEGGPTKVVPLPNQEADSVRAPPALCCVPRPTCGNTH